MCVTDTTSAHKLEHSADLTCVELDDGSTINVADGGFLVLNGTSASSSDSLLVFKEQATRVILCIQSKHTDGGSTVVNTKQFLDEVEKSSSDFECGSDTLVEQYVFMQLSNRREVPSNTGTLYICLAYVANIFQVTVKTNFP